MPHRDDDQEEEYEVEQILDVRFSGQGRRRQRQYLVLWRGYPLAEATWEPEDHCKNAPAAVAAFEQRQV